MYKKSFSSIIWYHVLIFVHCFQTISHNYHNAIFSNDDDDAEPSTSSCFLIQNVREKIIMWDCMSVWEEVLCKSLGLHYYRSQAEVQSLWTVWNDVNSLDDVVWFLCLITSCTRYDINIVLLYILLLLDSSLFAWPCNLPSNERIISNSKQCCEWYTTNAIYQTKLFSSSRLLS